MQSNMNLITELTLGITALVFFFAIQIARKLKRQELNTLNARNVGVEMFAPPDNKVSDNQEYLKHRQMLLERIKKGSVLSGNRS